MLRYRVCMVFSKRQLAILASALALGAAVAAGVWLFMNPSSLRMADNAKTTVMPAPAVALAPEPFAPCPSQPAAPVAGKKDGNFLMQGDLSGTAATDTTRFIVAGKEASVAGRPRDAEVAFLMACRVADKFKGASSVESADAKYQLAWQYEWLAREGGLAAAANRAELLKRADSLYSDSLKVYLAKFGQNHEKARFAADGLAAVQQILVNGQPVQRPFPAIEKPAEATVARKATEPASPTGERVSRPSRAPGPKPQPGKVELAQAAPSAGRQPGAAERPRPSFDCSKARSVPEKMICSDAELARVDRELGRLYARAKNSASNSAAFRRQNNDEWRRRESTCRDRECLLRWYAQRRDQLSNDINEARRQTLPTASRQSVL